ncbi:MAG: KEOPS complex subunit Pcc1 [Nitrososphaera sp.]
MPLSQLEVEVEIEIPFHNRAEAKLIMNALIPDNVDFPKGLSMKLFSRGSTIAVELTGKNIATATILSTLDEVLNHISLAKKVMTG